MPSPTSRPESPLWLKLESEQAVGAFKQPGAFNAILLRLEDSRERGVVAHSRGNHARAVAYAAKELGISATIVMPDAAPMNKIDAVQALGHRL